jgi:hypothetical protein
VGIYTRLAGPTRAWSGRLRRALRAGTPRLPDGDRLLPSPAEADYSLGLEPAGLLRVPEDRNPKLCTFGE